ncbi:hypothetical protein [Streptococcus suis]
MKHYFNKYNVINLATLIFVTTILIERLTWLLFVQMDLATLSPIIIFSYSLRLMVLISVATLFYTILFEFANRNAEFDYFSNGIKSYITTWKIRRFCTQINVTPTLDEAVSYQSSKQVIIKKANHSLLTLTVTFYNNKAIAKWQLPPNSESYTLMEELLPKVKQMLNQWDKDYLFNDFIPVSNSRLVESEATKCK